jgi:hypothetical protein
VLGGLVTGSELYISVQGSEQVEYVDPIQRTMKDIILTLTKGKE